MATKESVFIRAPQEKDDFGDPVGGENEWIEVRRCTVVPRESQDYNQRGTVIIHGFMVRMPAGTEITDHHELRIRGEVFQVDGAVGDFGRKGLIVYTMRAN